MYVLMGFLKKAICKKAYVRVACPSSPYIKIVLLKVGQTRAGDSYSHCR